RRRCARRRRPARARSWPPPAAPTSRRRPRRPPSAAPRARTEYGRRIWQSRAVDEGVVTALIAELGKKTSVCWLRYSVYDEPVREHGVWHVWHDDALALVSGGTEQVLPFIEDATSVEVTMRSKDNGGRLVTWVGAPSRLLPADDRWETTVAALASARISIPS